MNNPFPCSCDNKRYYTWSYYLKTRFGGKAAKVPLDAGFTCPNRDGTLGYGGCAFCPANGADSFPAEKEEDLLRQFSLRAEVLKKKWPSFTAIPYFQAYSNTYADAEVLRQVYMPFAQDPEIPMIVTATRPDCFNEEVYALFKELRAKKEIWVELGVQSVFDKTTDALNCAHPFSKTKETCARLAALDIPYSLHLINGLPGETAEMMLESAKEIARLKPKAVKFHCLLILKDSALEKVHTKSPLPLLSREEYLEILVKQLEVLPPDTIIERVTSDAPESELVAPLWPNKKLVVLNELDKLMVKYNTWQGRKYAAADDH